MDWANDYEAGSVFLERDGDGIAVLGVGGVLYTPEGPAEHNDWRHLPHSAQVPDGLAADLDAARAFAEGAAETQRIQTLHDNGHTHHCAARQVWGDGECECPGDGTGSPYHTMNPPPGGWPKREPVAVPMTAGEAMRALRTHQRMSMGDAARALGLSVVQVSALETGNDEGACAVVQRIDARPGDEHRVRTLRQDDDPEFARGRTRVAQRLQQHNVVAPEQPPNEGD